MALSLIFLGTLPSVADSKAEQWSYPSSNPELSSFDGSGTASSPYLIQSAQDLANLAYIVTDDNDDVTGIYFKMTRDIYLNDFTVDAKGNITANGELKSWTPIGENGFWRDDDFQGIFDGDGHTIYGLYIREEEDPPLYVGLFGSTDEAIIKNLTIKDAYIYTAKSHQSFGMGTLVGRCENSTLSNVHVEGCYGHCYGASQGCYTIYGGLIGYATNDVTLNDCSFTGDIRQDCNNESNVGGLIGEFGLVGIHSSATLRLTRCHTNAEIKVDCKESSDVHAGGLVGRAVGKFKKVYIVECLNGTNITINDNSDIQYNKEVNAYHFSFRADEIRRSVNLGNITINSDKITYAEIGSAYDCSRYIDCANYGQYFLPAEHDSTQILIHPGPNQVYHGSDGQNLIVWKEAKPTNLGAKDSYDSNGTELSIDSLDNNREIVARLNEDLGENVWGFYTMTYNGRTCYMPCPIACGATPIGLYRNYISSEADLRILQNLVKNESVTDGYYLLTHDIDMSASAPLTQIGDDDHPFTGTLDGNGHVISGLTIKGHALIGNLSGTVKNLGLVNMKFTGGNDYCAPFAYKAGKSAHASILNCYAGGNLTLADSTNTSTALAGLLYEASDHEITIKNSYFRGIMANSTNVSNQKHAYSGLVGSNQIGTNLAMTDCYAHFSYDDEDATGAGIMPSIYIAYLTNCHFLCPQITDGTGRVKSNGELAACFAGKEGWLTGAYRPVLEGVRHYELTTYDGQTVYADAIPLDDDSCRNEIFCHQLTSETANDQLLWALPKVAACDTENNVNYLINCQLYADKPFRFSPPEGSETKGQLHYPLTFSSEDEYPIRLMCLPATLLKSHLPEGTEVFLMSKPTGGADEGYEAYLVACDSVPAGVPFLILMNNKPTDTIDVVLSGDVVGSPQSTGTLNGEELESGLTGTFEDKHLESGCAGFDFSTAGVNIKYEADGIDLKPFEAYVDAEKADATVSCTNGVLLRETSNYIDQTLEMHKDRTVTVFLSRKLQTSGWNTLCLPFDISEEELTKNYGSDTRLEELTSITTNSDGTCTLCFTYAHGIKAGKCYLIQPGIAYHSAYQFDDKTLTTDLTPTTLSSSDGAYTISFLGSFARTAIDGNDTSKGTYFTQNNKIYKVAQGRTITMNGFRCWIETSKPDALTKANIVHADGTTSIARIVPIGTTEDNHRIYDLQGIEIQHPLPHHIYIMDGQPTLGR